MYRLSADTLTERTIPVLEADLPEPIFHDLFPVRFEDLDPLSAPEPSEGALIKLENGEVILTVYGKKTGHLVIEAPKSHPTKTAIKAILSEIPPLGEYVLWTAESSSRESDIE
jgi:hypothetical protein